MKRLYIMLGIRGKAHKHAEYVYIHYKTVTRS